LLCVGSFFFSLHLVSFRVSPFLAIRTFRLTVDLLSLGFSVAVFACMGFFFFVRLGCFHSVFHSVWFHSVGFHSVFGFVLVPLQKSRSSIRSRFLLLFFYVSYLSRASADVCSRTPGPDEYNHLRKLRYPIQRERPRLSRRLRLNWRHTKCTEGSVECDTANPVLHSSPKVFAHG
jgi:hypothetical protein